MKKMMLAVMAAMVIGSTGTALAATPGAVDCRDNAPCVEANYTCCAAGTTAADAADAAATAAAADMAAGTATAMKTRKDSTNTNAGVGHDSLTDACFVLRTRLVTF